MMENQQYQVSQRPMPPSINRINWTQTGTISLAAFVGCLAAVVAAVFIYKYLLSKKVGEQMAKLQNVEDLLAHQEGLLNEVSEERKSLQQANQRARIVAAQETAAAKKESTPAPAGNQESDDDNTQE